MLRSLLIGVNGSQWSQSALDLGLKWARSLGIPVTCLGVVDVESLTAAESYPVGGGAFKRERDAQLVAAAREKIETVLQVAVTQADALGVECHTRFVEGSPAEELGLEAQRHDLMLIGKRAVPKSDHDPAASTTMTDILRCASRPVAVSGSVPKEATEVLVAYDGSLQAARTLASFVASGLYAEYPLQVIGIGDEPARMEQVLQRALDYLGAHGRTARMQVLPVGNGIAHTLADFTTRLPACLLVMGVYGESRLKERLFGSVTRSLLARVPVPLFLDH